MRSQMIGLLAVFSYHAAAGPVRHRGAFLHQNKFPRFYNTSTISSTSDDLPTLAPVPITSSLSTFSTETTSDISSSEDGPATTPAQNPSSSSAPTGGDSSALAGSQNPTVTDAQSSVPSVTATPPYASSTPSLAAAFTTSDTKSEGMVSSSSGVASMSHSDQPGTLSGTSELNTASNVDIHSSVFASFGQSSSSSSSSLSTPTLVPTQSIGNAKSNVQSNSPPLKAAVVQLGASESAEFAPVTASAASATPTLPGIQYPSAQSGNKAMASGFNQIFAKLTETSPCNANDNNQAQACVSGQPASCNADGRYVLKSCPDEQSCYALPKPSGATGISVECAVPSDAAAKLSATADAGDNGSSALQQGSKSQSTATAAVEIKPSSTTLPQTEGVKIPVQQLSSSLPVTVVSQSQATSAFVQSTSHSLPETESVQIPVQRLTSSTQATPAPSTQIQAQQDSLSASTAVKVESAKSLAQGPSSASQVAVTAQGQQGSSTALTDTKSSVSKATEGAQPTAQTLQTFPAAQATILTQQSSLASGFGPAQTQIASQALSSTVSTVATAGPSTTAPLGGPIFSLPEGASPSIQIAQDHQAQPKESSSPVQDTSKAVPNSSALAQQQPAPSTETSVVPPPHVVQAAPEVKPSSAQGAVSTSAVDSNGAAIFSVESQGGRSTNSVPPTHEKLAVGNGNGTPIYSYITVTVTTTAYDHQPTA